MKIVVEGHLIETQDIWDIIYESSSREVWVKIKQIDKPTISVGCNIAYDTSNYQVQDKQAPYKRLYEEVKKKWESDKNDIPTFKI